MNGLSLYMKAFLDRYIFLVPIFMLLLALLSEFVKLDYVAVGNMVGWSILSNIPMFYFFNFKGKYCWFTRNAPIGLILINIVDIIGVFIPDEDYNFWFNVTICSTIIILALLFYIKKKLSHD